MTNPGTNVPKGMFVVVKATNNINLTKMQYSNSNFKFSPQTDLLSV